MKVIENLSVSSAQSLLDLCTQMVATHLDIVESFIGLPALIGERIFTVGSQIDRVTTDVEYSRQAVTLFTDAYGEEFLSSLNISGEHLGLNYCLEQILLFTDLIRLDLSDCGLGDDHEMLAQIQHLHRLEALSLKGNAVTDVGIQKMTTPYRMFQRGPAGLEMLDLRDNALSRQCLKYLAKFESLHTVMFSEPGEERKGIPAVTHHSEHFGCWTLFTDEMNNIEVHTEGWAKVLINRWMMEARLKSVKNKPVSKTGIFSVRRCSLMETSNLSAICSSARNQCHIAAKRGYISGVKTDLGKTSAVETVETIGDAEIGEERVEELFEMYKETKALCHDERSLLQRLESCEREDKRITPQSDAERWKRNKTGTCFFKSANVKKQNSTEDNVKNRNTFPDGVYKKGKRSISDFMIRKSVNVNENLKRNNTCSSDILYTSLSNVSCQTARDGLARADNQSKNIQSSQNVSSERHSFNSSGSLSSASVKINSLQTLKSNCNEIMKTKSLNRKSRKRKRIVIKKKPETNSALSCENDSDEVESNIKTDSSNVISHQLIVGKENMPDSKRLKTTFLQHLDEHF